MTNCLKAVDVFSGCGGLSLGLRQAGFEVIAAIEIETKSARIYEKNHPTTKMYIQDVRALAAEDLMQDLGIGFGELDLLAGCPPCQGFSRIRRKNKRRVTLDKRNVLIDEFSSLVAGLRPRAVMLENVPALLSYARFVSFKKMLVKMGYKYKAEILDVSDFGVPQRRKRLVLTAALAGEPAMAQPSTRKVTVKDAIGDLPKCGAGSDPLHDLQHKRTKRVQDIIVQIRKDGGSRKELPASLTLACHRKSDGFSDVYGRMSWLKIAPTITSGCNNPSKGRFIHPEENRAITLREAAVLQGFPFNYYFDITAGKESLALMIGNALPPPFVQAQARAIASFLSLKGPERGKSKSQRVG